LKIRFSQRVGHIRVIRIKAACFLKKGDRFSPLALGFQNQSEIVIAKRKIRIDFNTLFEAGNRLGDIPFS